MITNRYWFVLFWFIFLFQNLLFQTIYANTDQASSVLVSEQKASDQDRQAIEAISAILLAGRDKTDEVLKSVGFNDDVVKNISDFKKWPSFRKIETAYFSAVAAGKAASGSEEAGLKEGDRFLQAISLEIAQNHSDAIRYEPALHHHFSQSKSKEKINFASLAQLPETTSDINVQRAIKAIERYVSNAPGGMVGAMRACCNLQEEKIFEALRSSPNNKEALIFAIEKSGIPPQLQEKMIRLVKNIAETTHAIFYESDLEPYLKKIDAELGDKPSGLAQRDIKPHPEVVSNITAEDESKVKNIVVDVTKRAGIDASVLMAAFSLKTNQSPIHPDAGNPPSPKSGSEPDPSSPQNPSGGGSEQEVANVVPDTVDNSPSANGGSGGGGPITPEKNFDRFKNVTESIEPQAKGKPFSRGPSGLPKVSFHTMRTGRGGFGGVVFGSPVDGKNVDKPTQLFWVNDVEANSANDDWGHYDIVLGKNTIVSTRRFHSADAYAAWEIVAGRKGKGGFAPLDFTYGEGIGLASVPQGEDKKLPVMVVHPAIYGLAIGDAAAMADAIGFKMSVQALVQHIKEAKIPTTIIEKAIAWRSADSGYYKIIDTPLLIKNSDGIIRVARSDKSNYSDKLKEVAFLDFQAFDWYEKPLPSESLPFYEVLPALTTVFPAFERLNSFSEILGVMRWASASKAKITPPKHPGLQPAKLYLHKLPNGDLAQLEKEPSKSQINSEWLAYERKIAGEKLAQVPEDAAELKTLLSKDGAPNPILACVDKITAVKTELLRIGLAKTEIKRQSKLTSEQKDIIFNKLQDDSNERRESLKGCNTKEDMLNLVLDKSSIDQLSKLRKDIEDARNRYWKSMEAVDDAEGNLPTPEQLISQQSEAKRKLIEPVQKRRDAAKDKYWKAKSPTAKKEAIKDYEAADEQLEKLLPSPDTTAVDAARQIAEKDLEKVESARNSLSDMEKKLTPVWLDNNWSAIEKFLPSFWYF